MEGARKMVMKLRGDLLGYCETGPGCCSLLFSVSWWHRLVRLGDRCIESQQAAFLGTNMALAFRHAQACLVAPTGESKCMVLL